MQTHNFSLVPCECEDFLPGLDVPQLSCVVHASGGYQHAVGIERETDNLHLVAFQSVVALACFGVPNLGFLVEGAGHNFIAKGLGLRLTQMDC